MAFVISLPFRQSAPQPVPATETDGADPATGANPVLRFTGIDGRTRITTSFGEVPAALLRRGDQVKALDGRYVDVVAIDKIVLDADFLDYHPEAAPVCIPEGSLGPHRPARDIYLAPDQVVGGGISNIDIRVCRASDLAAKVRQRRVGEEMVTYYLIKLSEPCAMMSEKVWVKSA